MHYLIEVIGLEEDGTAKLGKPLAIAHTRDAILKARIEHIRMGFSKRSLVMKEMAT